MEDYKKMYCLLFNKITDTIRDLQQVQQKTEELYISAEDSAVEIRELPTAKD